MKKPRRWIWGRGLHRATIGSKLPYQRYWVADGTLWLDEITHYQPIPHPEPPTT